MVNIGLDDFYDHVVQTYERVDTERSGVGEIDVRRAERYAARWLLIALTHAMDTLVVQIGRHPSPVRDALKDAGRHCRGFVRWVE